ncbi:FtsK/SpoIIIE domain-containing protein [Serinicoccus sediminis]|uniref:FtsK/SpoIIIE domain-containing protein n=1 Tax=Serinicoccus sediminis TaxID=2306021 RepID=UPI001020BB4F|nr:FtsK/SpoIIIE domain-containing protein [Serinicoccus sediminis]
MAQTSVDEAVAEAAAAQGLALSCVAAALRDAAQKREHAAASGGSGRDRAMAAARTRSAQEVSVLETGARDLALSLTDEARGVADYVDLGRLESPGERWGVHHRVGAPFVLPLIGRGNVVLDVGREAQLGLAGELVCQALERTAAGQLGVTCFDPLMSSLMAPFARLREVSEGVVRTIMDPSELSEHLERLSQEVLRVNDLLGGRSSLLEARRNESRSFGEFSLLVLVDAPEGLSEDLFERLVRLAAVGPRVGVSQLWLPSTASTTPDWWDTGRLTAVSQVLKEERGRVTWPSHAAYAVVPRFPGPEGLEARSSAVGEALRTSSSEALGFLEIQPTEQLWQDKSASGLTFALGISGGRTVEITLGDSRDQRHNVLITGAAGNGKSNLLKVMIFSLCQRYSPDELELVMLDFKDGATLYPLSPRAGAPDYLPHARVLGLESDQEFGAAVLRWVQQEVSRRMRLIRPYGQDISQYREQVPNARLPRMVVVIDEFQGLLAETEDDTGRLAATALEQIAKQGRAAGVHLVLASQTISGITTLLAKEDGIYAQFPIRLALKNSESESQAGLARGNVAAARLPGRGTAVVNRDYGAMTANRRVTVAHLPQGVAEELQRTWWEQEHGEPPVVVDSTEPARIGHLVEALQLLRTRVARDQAAPTALLGRPLSVSSSPVGLAMSSTPGRHLAILGAGEEEGSDHSWFYAEPAAANSAVGILQCAAVSLALQDPLGTAQFVSLDLLDSALAERNNQDEWAGLMERLGFTLHRPAATEVADFLVYLASELDDRPPGQRTYLLGFNLDRAPQLDAADAFGNTPLDALREILRTGPVRGVHLLGWWANPATYAAHLGFGSSGYVDAHAMLRLDQSAVQDILGPFVRWSVRSNRALVADRTQSDPTIVVPFAPVSAADRRALLSAEWGE